MNLARMATAADIADLERHEVIGGEIVEKASPSGEHAGAQYVLSMGLGPYYGRGGGDRPGGWWLMTEVEIELEPHEVYVPDVAGWRIERAAERPRGKPVRVAPDWVCEVLSPSTASKDTGQKQHGYHRAGVGHYWIVDPRNLSLTVLRWHEASYQILVAAGPGDVVRAQPFDAVKIKVAEIFGLDNL